MILVGEVEVEAIEEAGIVDEEGEVGTERKKREVRIHKDTDQREEWNTEVNQTHLLYRRESLI